MKNIKTYIIRSNYSAEPSYAICTAYKNDDAGFQGESFLIFQMDDAKPELVSTMLFVENDAESSLPLKREKRFFLAEALGQAKTAYRKKVHQMSSTEGPAPWWPLRRETSKISSKELVNICRRHPAIREPLQRIGSLTKHQRFAAFLDNLSVHHIRLSRKTLESTTSASGVAPLAERLLGS